MSAADRPIVDCRAADGGGHDIGRTAADGGVRDGAAGAERPAGDELDSRQLFSQSRRRVIVHQGERYCLQLTRAGKLLLTK